MKRALISFVFFLIAGTACGPAATPVPDTATPEPTLTNTPVPPTFTPTPTLTPTPTQTPTSTPTPTPTQTHTPTVTPTSVLNDLAQEELKSYGIDPLTGKVIYAAVEPKELEAIVADSVVYSVYEDLGEIEDFVMQYQVRAESSASVYGCGVLFHLDNDFVTFNEGHRLIALTAPGLSLWAAEYIKDDTYEMVVKPARTFAFTYKADSLVTFTLIVKGSQVEFYSGANRIGRFTSQRTKGKVGLVGLNASDEGTVKCTFENVWIWSTK